MKVINKIKSFYEWYISFIRNHPLISLFSVFIKGMIIGGLIVFLYFQSCIVCVVGWLFYLKNKELYYPHTLSVLF